MNFSNDIPGPEVLKALARMETRRANTKAKNNVQSSNYKLVQSQGLFYPVAATSY